MGFGGQVTRNVAVTQPGIVPMETLRRGLMSLAAEFPPEAEVRRSRFSSTTSQTSVSRATKGLIAAELVRRRKEGRVVRHWSAPEVRLAAAYL